MAGGFQRIIDALIGREVSTQNLTFVKQYYVRTFEKAMIAVVDEYCGEGRKGNVSRLFGLKVGLKVELKIGRFLFSKKLKIFLFYGTVVLTITLIK